MKNIGAIEASKQRVLAWSGFLLDTFQKLGITDSEVIRSCHIGRSTFYRMKHGEQINTDAYVRLNDYAIMKIYERMEKKLLPNNFMEEYKKSLTDLWRFHPI